MKRERLHVRTTTQRSVWKPAAAAAWRQCTRARKKLCNISWRVYYDWSSSKKEEEEDHDLASWGARKEEKAGVGFKLLFELVIFFFQELRD